MDRINLAETTALSSREGARIFYIGTDKRRKIKAVESTQAQHPGNFPWSTAKNLK